MLHRPIPRERDLDKRSTTPAYAQQSYTRTASASKRAPSPVYLQEILSLRNTTMDPTWTLRQHLLGSHTTKAS